MVAGTYAYDETIHTLKLALVAAEQAKKALKAINKLEKSIAKKCRNLDYFKFQYQRAKEQGVNAISYEHDILLEASKIEAMQEELRSLKECYVLLTNKLLYYISHCRASCPALNHHIYKNE